MRCDCDSATLLLVTIGTNYLLNVGKRNSWFLTIRFCAVVTPAFCLTCCLMA